MINDSTYRRFNNRFARLLRAKSGDGLVVLFLRICHEQCQGGSTLGLLLQGVEVVNDLGTVKTYKEKSGEAPFYLTERNAIASMV